MLRSILPPIHDRELTLPRLELYAIAFDEISDETGAHYSAGAFVAWLKAELDTPTVASQRIRSGRRQEG
jgi:hypothetical protein